MVASAVVVSVTGTVLRQALNLKPMRNLLARAAERNARRGRSGGAYVTIRGCVRAALPLLCQSTFSVPQHVVAGDAAGRCWPGVRRCRLAVVVFLLAIAVQRLNLCSVSSSLAPAPFGHDTPMTVPDEPTVSPGSGPAGRMRSVPLASGDIFGLPSPLRG